jgi:AraC-like DNA-binding protein
MDAVAALLDGPRAHEAFLLRAVMNPPWSMRVRDEAPLTVVGMLSGTAWVIPDDGDPVALGPGDVAIIRGPDHYTVADDIARVPDIVIHPDQRCETLDGRPLVQDMALGVRTWGNAVDGETVMLVGTYHFDGEVSRRLLRALPMVLALREHEWDCPVIPLLATEIVKDDPGQAAVLDRLLDLLLIAALRAWFARPEAQAAAWYRAHADPVVGRALRMLHHNPAHPWTVARLADEAGVSRATFARRFHELVGEPPMAFLTNWRVALAADLLREPGATIGSVAHEVGYGSPFALSTAFKRVRGVSPQQHRAAFAA